jgi:ATPase subunit of ABC transporter with duplicated ATPase domains
MLTIADVSKSYGTRELFSDVSLFVARTDRFGLVGPNGAGKSTLFNLILGEEQADDRHHRVGARRRLRLPPAGKRPRRRRVHPPHRHQRQETRAQNDDDLRHRLDPRASRQEDPRRPRLQARTTHDQAGQVLLRRLGHARPPRPPPGQPSLRSSCSTSRPTTSISRRCSGSRTTSRATRAGSSSSPTTAPS